MSLLINPFAFSGGGAGGSGDAYADLIAADSPVAWWRLNETSGTVAADSIGSNHGTYVGSPTLGEPSFPGGASSVLFGATSKYVNIGNVLPLTADRTMSMEAWMQLSAGWTNTWQPIFTKGDSGWRLARWGSQPGIQFAVQPSNTANVTTSDSVNDTSWHHIVGVAEAGTLIIYIDGTARASLANSVAVYSTTASVRIGGNSEQTARLFPGRIADCALYDYALSATQVAAHHSTGMAA